MRSALNIQGINDSLLGSQKEIIDDCVNAIELAISKSGLTYEKIEKDSGMQFLKNKLQTQSLTRRDISNMFCYFEIERDKLFANRIASFIKQQDNVNIIWRHMGHIGDVKLHDVAEYIVAKMIAELD